MANNLEKAKFFAQSLADALSKRPSPPLARRVIASVLLSLSAHGLDDLVARTQRISSLVDQGQYALAAGQARTLKRLIVAEIESTQRAASHEKKRLRLLTEVECPHCSELTDFKGDFCAHCSEKLQKIQCVKCGKLALKDWTVCASCLSRLHS